jgi:cereblon
MALITSTHGDAAMDATTAVGVDGIISGFTASSPSSQWRSPQDQGEIVVTALGTSRFRIHSFVNSDEADAASRNPTGRILGGARTFWVQELVDEPLSLPPLNLRHFGAQSQAVATQTTIPTLSYHNRLIHGLSTVSPLPSFVYQLAWPWKMVADIVQAVKRVSIFSGFSDSIPSLEDNDNSGSTYRFLEPLAFSFWMASNIPLSENEKLALLEMHSTVERLQYIRHKIAGEERIESYIHCKSCGIPLSRATFMFSVGGAEGTTGAYVNEHGFIHQTITVRQVCENEVWFTGELETRDSWFDGYAWQIMSCQFCNSHLGWKFRRVPEGDNAAATAPDRLELFYGLSAASVALHGASTSNGRIYR